MRHRPPGDDQSGGEGTKVAVAATLAGTGRRLVVDVMSREPFTVPVHVPAHEAQWLAERRRLNHLLVTERGGLCGIACVCDLWWTSRDQIIGQVMTAAPYDIGPAATLADAARIMSMRGVGALPVIDNGALLGIVTRGDLIRAGHWSRDTVDRRCLLCGSHHHVRLVAGSARPILCVFCLGSRDPDEIAQVLRTRGVARETPAPQPC